MNPERVYWIGFLLGWVILSIPVAFALGRIFRNAQQDYTAALDEDGVRMGCGRWTDEDVIETEDVA